MSDESDVGEDFLLEPQASTSYRPIAPLPNGSVAGGINGKGAEQQQPSPEEEAAAKSRSFTSETVSRASVFQPRSPEAQAAAKANLASQQASSSSASNSSSASQRFGSPGAQKRSRVEPSLNPTVPKVPKTTTEKENTPRLIVVLEQACLETYKLSSGSATAGPGMNGWGPQPTGRGRRNKDGGEKYALLNCDDHQRALAKMGRDIAEARPDITHQVGTLWTSSQGKDY